MEDASLVDSPCTIAIDTAQRDLETAVAKSRNQSQNNDLEAMNNDTSTIISDPDDLAAAFFAAEARKKEEVTKLPIDDWSTHFPELKLRCTSSQQEESSHYNDCTTKEFMDQAARFRTQLKEKLVQAFMNELLKEAENKMKI